MNKAAKCGAPFNHIWHSFRKLDDLSVNICDGVPKEIDEKEKPSER